MLLTALLVEDTKSSQSVKPASKALDVARIALAGLKNSLMTEHQGRKLIDCLSLLTLNNTLIDLCFDWHPSHVNKKSLDLSMPSEHGLQQMLLQAICERIEFICSDGENTSESASQRRQDLTLTVNALKKYIFFRQA